MEKDKRTFKPVGKQNAEIKRFYEAWEQADRAQMLLRSALAILEEAAKDFTDEAVQPTASYTDGVCIKWEAFDTWGFRDFFSPEEFLTACKQRKIKQEVGT